MSRLVVDTHTAALVRACLDRCARNGGDPVRALDAAGLLAFPRQQQHVEQAVLLRAAAALDEATVAQIAAPNLVPATALDMKNAVALWLRSVAAVAVQPRQ